MALRIKLINGKTVQAPSGNKIADVLNPLRQSKAVGARWNDRILDLRDTLPDDGLLSLLDPTDSEGLNIARHDLAHTLAQAVGELFPKTLFGFGPATTTGFIYDVQTKRPLTPKDLPAIESRMRKIIIASLPVERKTMKIQDALSLFGDQPFKQETVERLTKEGWDTVTVYRQGDFVDLCRGPHALNTHSEMAFTIEEVSGAYWLGDPSRPQLQRIHVLAFASPQDLKQHIENVRLARERDHRLLGQKMDLFHFQPEAPGSAFWHPKGWTVYQTLERYMRGKFMQYDFEEVSTPPILRRNLWEQSGHWDKFGEDMFSVPVSPQVTYALKPMNCPAHVQIFKQKTVSYRDLPVRLAEFGACARNEKSGAIYGLMRGHTFHQDDAHIFCTEEQVNDEVSRFTHMLCSVYKLFGFEDVNVALSTRPDKRAGDDALWDKTEKLLEAAAKIAGLRPSINPGEGSFYGPKLEFSLRDSLHRFWQCGTIQLDFILPARLGATYVDSRGDKRHPVLLHRAIFGSLERFIGILLEHTNGYLPIWLAPVQLVVMGITDDLRPYVDDVAAKFHAAGVRVYADRRSDKLGYKIREHSIARVPYAVILGPREKQQGTISLKYLPKEDVAGLPITATEAPRILDLSELIDILARVTRTPE